jgi:hypothetical protein
MRGIVIALVSLRGIVAWAQSAPEPVPPGALPGTAEPEPPGGGPAQVKATTPTELGKYQLGARVRGIFVTHAMLQPYLAANTGTSMESWAVGTEFIYRRRSYDVVTSVDFSWLDVHDGNYLGADHDPSLDTHYVQFRGLSFISADVSIIGHTKFSRWLELRYGGGLGLGAVLGDILLTNNGPQCTKQNAADINQCYPVGIRLGQPDTEQKLKATEGTGVDTAQTPHRHVSNDKPPVMGVVNILVGLRFYPAPHWAITYELGFRNAIFTGLGVHYLF